jgi:ADP-heptose:LPS heptosyltransferase
MAPIPDPGFYLTRTGGLGDVLMALAAAKALKLATGAPVRLVTAPAYRALAQACPHLDQVLTTAEEARSALEDVRRSAAAGRVQNLDAAKFGSAPRHQVDAYLEAFGLSAPADAKDIQLELPTEVLERVTVRLAGLPPLGRGKRILLHPATGDPNRTWPLAHWQTLAEALLADGHQLLRVGKSQSPDGRGIHPLADPRVLQAVDLPSALDFVALCRNADLLVSTDSGPVQLAGATDLALVGIYTVVPGRNRLPFRHGAPGWRATAVEAACPSFPCYQFLNDPAIMAPFHAAIRAGTLTAPRLFAEWCVREEPFVCLEREILPERVLRACRERLQE